MYLPIFWPKGLYTHSPLGCLFLTSPRFPMPGSSSREGSRVEGRKLEYVLLIFLLSKAYDIHEISLEYICCVADLIIAAKRFSDRLT